MDSTGFTPESNANSCDELRNDGMPCICSMMLTGVCCVSDSNG